jgi:uracil-DNA glycosylase
VTADDLDAAFATIPSAWRRAIERHSPGVLTQATVDALVTRVRAVSGDKSIGPSDPFRALRFVGPESVRVVLVGQDPYPTPGQADGLAFSAARLSSRPSLRRIADVLEADRPGWRRPVSGRLDVWARQGVLLLNTALTVEEGRAEAHLTVGWQVITTAIVKVASIMSTDIALMLWGRQAQAFASGVGARSRLLLDRHPSNDYRREFMAARSHFDATADRVDWWAWSDGTASAPD